MERESVVFGVRVWKHSVRLLPHMSSNESCPRANDYDLGCCCNSVQIQTLCAVGVYSVLFFLLWRTFLMDPLKVVTHAMFEINRCLGCWMTCGKVASLKLFLLPTATSTTTVTSQTEFVGGNRFAIQLTGLLGALVWGLVCIVASADFVGVQVVAGVLSLVLLLLLVLARTWRIVASVMLLLVLMIAFWVCTVLTVFNGLRFLVLAIGVCSLFHPLYNVCLVPSRPPAGYDGLPGSGAEDAKPISSAAKTGEFVWGVISLSVAGVAVYLALVVGSNPDTK
ncbi:hypothetical protein BASA81_003578 [Batrachochytrium salamandrivorans]|nr:hypothetical protein BASA81_003578 [Batrachochytrium salamandrivorans]